jgi:4-amino-4-deoxy-L-arabinose transferase-like glycosyltransferase
MPGPTEHRRWLLGILALALLLRVVVAIGLQWRLGDAFLIPGDANGYWELGERTFRGDDYALYTPPRQVLRMPGFPAFLAASMTLGSGLLPARLLLCVVGTVACGLVYWLGRELVDPGAGLIAAALAAVCPTLVGFTPLILSETLFAACLLGSLIAMAVLVRGRSSRASAAGGPPMGGPVRRWLLALGTGALIGIACYVRPSWLLSAPAFAALILLLRPNRRAAAVEGALVVAAVLLTLVPWGLRNQRVTGHFVLTTLWVGPSLYDGLNPDATGDSNMAFYDRDNLLGRGLTEYEVDRHYRREALDFVRSNPGRALRLAFVKLGRFLNPLPNAQQFGQWWLKAAVAASFVPALLFAVRGGWDLRRDTWALILTAGPLLYFASIHMVFVSSLRYRLPAEYPLLVLSAVGLRCWCPLLARLPGAPPV